MSLIREINISEFRGIRSLRKPIELGEFNVLVGRNNVGKSAVLEALYLIAGKEEDPVYRTRTRSYNSSYIPAVISDLHGGKDTYSPLVYGYAGRSHLEYRIRSTKASKNAFSPSAKVPDIIERVDVWIERTGITAALEGVKVGNTPRFLELDVGSDKKSKVLSFYIPNDSTSYMQIRDYVLREDVFSQIVKDGNHKRVIEDLLSGVIYDKFTEVLIERGDLKVRKEASGGVGPLYINVESLGDGVKRALLAYLAVEHLNPLVLLWDDIEVAAHPSLVRAVLRWLSGSGRQVVISTQSIDVLYELTQVRPRDCRIIVLRKDESDVVSHRSLNLDELDEFFEGGLDLRRMIEEMEL